jgi:hypothetical protein
MYQKTDAIAESGLIEFNCNASDITSENGGLFYITNSEAVINISRSNIITTGVYNFLLKCTGNNSEKQWGIAAENGGKCVLNANNQILNGTIYWDSISEVTINLSENSELTTSIIDDESHNGGAIGAKGFCDVNIDATSKFIVNGNCRLRNMVNSSDNIIKDIFGKVVTIVNYNNILIVDCNSDFLISVSSYSGIVEES